MFRNKWKMATDSFCHRLPRDHFSTNYSNLVHTKARKQSHIKVVSILTKDITINKQEKTIAITNDGL